MRLLFYALLLASTSCKREDDRQGVPVSPADTTRRRPDSAFYHGVVTNYIGADCLNAITRNFDSAYPATMMIEYPDSGSIRFHFSFANYRIDYNTCAYEQYNAVRTPIFPKGSDSTYVTGDSKTLTGATSYQLRGDSLLIRESGRDEKWLFRYTTFSGKK